MVRLLIGFLILLVAAPLSDASAIALKKSTKLAGVRLVPHRAVYNITLADRQEGVSVSNVVGRMVFEVTGSPCDGYTQNMRMVTRISDEQGKATLSDIRSSTWEQGRGRRFRFSSSQYFDQALQEVVSGSATRKKKSTSLRIKLKKPAKAVLDLKGDILFPTQHSLAILASAEAGKSSHSARIYDGSEQGRGFYQTYTFIGKKKPPYSSTSDAKRPQKKYLKALGLDQYSSWPIAISYFDVDGGDRKLPSYELSFRLYPNGVSRKLLINYGEFSVHGKLDRIIYLRKRRCK